MFPPASQVAIAAARQFLPAWVVWGNDVVFVATFLLGPLIATWLATRYAMAPLRIGLPASWTERARLAYVVRWVMSLAVLLYPFAAITWAVASAPHLSPIPRLWLGGSTALIIFVLIIGYRRRVALEIRAEQVSVVDLLRSAATWMVVLVPHFSAALVVLTFMPDEFNRKAAILLALTVLSSLVLALGLNLYVARWLGLARPVSARLREIVDQKAAHVGVQIRGVYEIDLAVVNAFAFPFLATVTFTKKAIRLLSEEELEAICAHELGHLAEPKAGHLVRLTVVLTTAVYVAAIRPLAGTVGILGLGLSILAYLVVVRLFASFSRRIERGTDAAAAGCVADAAIYARALEKLYRLNLSPAVVGSKFLCHPELYDRLLSAGIQPEYPRPAPPSRRRMWAGAGIVILPVLIAVGLPLVATLAATRADSRNERHQHWGLIFGGPQAWHMHNLGQIRFDARLHDQAVAFLRAAVELDQTGWAYPANLGAILSYLDHCDEARAALEDAKRRLGADPNATAEDEVWIKEFVRGLDDCFARLQERPLMPQADAVAYVAADGYPPVAGEAFEPDSGAAPNVRNGKPAN